MAEYSKLARGSFITAATPVTQVVNLPFQPTRVELRNITAYSTPSQFAVSEAWWDIAMAQGTADIQYISAGSAPWNVGVDYVGTAGISTFGLLGSVNAGLTLQYGAQLQIASISKANPAVVTTASAHGLSTGQVVILEGLYQSPPTTGMPQIASLPFVITVTSPTTFTIPWNTNQSNYTALSASPTGAFVRQVLFPWNYLPGVNDIAFLLFSGAATAGSVFPTTPANVPAGQTYVATTSNHNYVVGQEVAFRIPPVWGTIQLNSLPNALVPGSPIYGYVVAVLSNTQFVVNINSASYTAFNSNPTVAQAVGLTPAQVVAAGDINSGGFPYTGGALYPAPQFPTFSGGMPTVNGPAIQGAFVNNTAQGFTVGLGVGTVQASAALLTPSSTYVWTAMFFDIG